MATAEEKALWKLPLWELDTIDACTKVGVPISTVHPGMIIEWGDHTKTIVTSAADYVHEYDTPGRYHIVIRYDAWDTVELAVSNETDVSSPLAEARTSLAAIGRLPPVANTSFAYLFYGYTGLLDIAADLFDDHGDKTDFSYTFAGCSNLTLIPMQIFLYTPNATNFTGTFAGCASITEVPEFLFADNPKATVFDSTFSSCTGLTSISTMAFTCVASDATFTATFRNCVALKNVDEPVPLSMLSGLDVFDGCTNLQLDTTVKLAAEN